mgnify:FL=1|tara:strand:+ start:130 stop:774 length:645 start_codon:yes stop_codon:yes gene_type:complete
MKKIILTLLIVGNIYSDIPKEEFAECLSKSSLQKNSCFENLGKKYKVKKIDKTPVNPDDMGDWYYNFYVDEFGDKTNDGYLAINEANGKFDNSAASGRDLIVRIFLSDGNETRPWFRFWEYGRSLVKTSYGSTTLRCRLKIDGEEDMPVIDLYQNEGWDHFNIRTAGQKLVANLILEEKSFKASCYDKSREVDKYRFGFNFKNYKNAYRIFKNS